MKHETKGTCETREVHAWLVMSSQGRGNDCIPKKLLGGFSTVLEIDSPHMFPIQPWH